MKFSSINKSKIFNWSILLFSLFPILPNKIKGLPVILLLITSLFFFKRKNIMWWRFFLNSSLYFLFLFSFFITENIGLEAKFRLETTLSILVIPVIFYILIPSVKFQKKLLNNFIRVFIFSSIVFMLIVFLYIILDRDTIYYSSWFANKARTLIVEVPYIGQHPIYASIFSSISLIFIIKLFRDNKNKSLLKGILTTLGILSQSLFLILIISKAVVISLLVSLVFYFFTLIKSNQPLKILELPTPTNLYATVIHPQIEVKTSDARALLKKKIPLKKAITQWANLGALVSGLYEEDYELISRSLEDVIVEPIRSILIPDFDALKEGCKKAGALGSGISGSGPSVFALSKGIFTAHKVAEAMKAIYQKTGIEFDTHVSTLNYEGIKILEYK